MNKKVLVVEDDKRILKLIVENLIDEGYEAITANDGEAALNLAIHSNPDIIVLDLNIPKLNGSEVCAQVRKRKLIVPIIMLTARKSSSDKISGLKLGADDYLTKPFNMEELLARIEALLRRALIPKVGKKITHYTLGRISIDFVKMEALKKNKPIKFTKRQYDILYYLFQREGEVVTRDDLLKAVWQYQEDITTRTVDTAICDLRKKIEENPSKPKYILSVHSAGYKFVSDI